MKRGYFLPERSSVRLDIFDNAVKKVSTLADGIRDAGRYKLE